MMALYVVCMCMKVTSNTGVPVDMRSSSSLWMKQQGCEHCNIKNHYVTKCYAMTQVAL